MNKMERKRLNVRNRNFTNDKYNMWMKNPKDRIKRLVTVGEHVRETGRHGNRKQPFWNIEGKKIYENPGIHGTM